MCLRTGSSSSMISIERILGHPVIEPPGKGGANQIHGVLVVIEIAANHADQVIDVFVRLDALVFGDVHGAGGANLADVVAEKVHDHGKLGVVFGCGFQLVPQALVLLGRLASGPGSLDGASLHGLSAKLDETLGRGRDDLVIAGLHEGEERRRIASNMAREEREGVAAELRLEPLRHVDLIDVAAHDVVANGLDGVDVLLTRQPGRCSCPTWGFAVRTGGSGRDSSCSNCARRRRASSSSSSPCEHGR
jgi:hypothetical protein